MRLSHLIYALPLRLRSVLRHSQVEQDLDEKLQFHLEQKIDDLVARGHSTEKARRLEPV